MGAESWGRAPNRKAMPLREEGTLHNMFFIQRASCYRNHARQERAPRGSTTETVLSELNKYYNKARPTSGMRGIKLLHDNAPAHKSKLVQEYLSKENIQTLPHPPYSPDLAPCDFVLFPLSKKGMSGLKNHLTFVPWIRRFPVFHIPKRGL